MLWATQMVLVLKKEVVKTNNVEHEDTGKYRQLLVRTLHQCSVKFPDVASTIIPVVSQRYSRFCQKKENFCVYSYEKFVISFSVFHVP